MQPNLRLADDDLPSPRPEPRRVMRLLPGDEPLRLADPDMDMGDQVLGLALFDAAYREQLLENPAAMLIGAAMSVPLKHAISVPPPSSLQEIAGRIVAFREREQSTTKPARWAEPNELGDEAFGGLR